MMQRSSYSAYDDVFKSELEFVHSACGIDGDTNLPPQLLTASPKAKPFCVSGEYHQSADGDTCDLVAQSYNVASASLFSANQDLVDCSHIPGGLNLCLPLRCAETYTLRPTDTCDIIGAAHGLVDSQLKAYNPWINWDCSNLNISTIVLGSVICLSPQGGKYASNSTGLQDTVYPGLRTGYSSEGSSPPENVTIAAGTTIYCGKWHVAMDGETCASICIRERITSSLFLEVNPSLKSSDCSSSLNQGLGYCVGPMAFWNSTMISQPES
jgi:hypothetical protein